MRICVVLGLSILAIAVALGASRAQAPTKRQTMGAEKPSAAPSPAVDKPHAAGETPSIDKSRDATVTPNEDVRPPNVTPAMRRYSRIHYALYFLGIAYSVICLWLILASGLSTRIRDFAKRAAPPRFLTLLLYYLLLSLVILAMEFPLSYYSGYHLEHSYGLSHQSLTAWLTDDAKGWGVDLIVTVLCFRLLYRLMGKFPKRWSIACAVASIPLVAIGLFVVPLVIDPVFNKFTPMPAGPLRTSIAALAAKAGIPNAPVYVVDKSRQTLTTNAYVTGIGPSARIVIWDTTLQRMPPDQVVAIVGHEMGHYVLKHIYWGFAATCALLFILLPLSQCFLEFMTARFGSRWGIQCLDDPAAIPLFLITLTLAQFLLAPLTNAVSRQIEHAADAYGIEVTGNHAAMARAFVSLSEQNLSDPDPPAFIKFWLFSHPPLKERIDFALGHAGK